MAEQKSNDDSEDVKLVSLDDEFKFYWRQSDNIQTIRDLCDRLNVDNVEGFILQLKDPNYERVMQEWELSTDLDVSIQWQDSNWDEHVYLDFYLIDTNPDVYLNDSHEFEWKESDNINTLRDLVTKLGINWEIQVPHFPLQLWLEDENGVTVFHKYLREEYMDIDLDFSREDYTKFQFRADWLPADWFNDDTSSEESSSKEEEKDEEQVADDTDADLANQMRRMRMTSRDAASAQARLEDEQSESRRAENDTKRKRVLPQLQLRF